MKRSAGRQAGIEKAARGFTLAELVIAVGAVVLLTLGIAQIFQQVSKLVGTGSALSEIDQTARVLETQLRDDIAALNRMATDETYLAIRNRRLDGAYASRDDLQTDLRAQIVAGDEGSLVRDVRLDEVQFMGSSAAYESYQHARHEGNPVIATVARIQWGHGVRPVEVSGYDPGQPISAGNRPVRSYLADDASGGTVRFGEAFGAAESRNEFAADFILARQAMLLYGPLAMGYQDLDQPSPRIADRPSPIGIEREYAPYIRDVENRGVFRLGPDPATWQLDDLAEPRVPSPRRIGHGQVDICAMDVEGVRRWLEGQEFLPASATRSPRDASPFDAGWADEDPRYDFLLWIRANPALGMGGGLGSILISDRIGVQSAIAGTFVRLLCESEPPVIVRDAAQSDAVDPEDAVMDLHATFSAHCSSFEVAWSDGTTWLSRSEDLWIDRDQDGDDEYLGFGDIVWFDIDFTREDLFDLNRQAYQMNLALSPEVPRGTRDARLRGAGGSGGYDWRVTGGSPNSDDEYLALWGFREPLSSGQYGPGWAKPRLLRVRATLHDAQHRIRGKVYEFVFAINTK